jgi:hypothetical protein
MPQGENVSAMSTGDVNLRRIFFMFGIFISVVAAAVA